MKSLIGFLVGLIVAFLVVHFGNIENLAACFFIGAGAVIVCQEIIEII